MSHHLLGSGHLVWGPLEQTTQRYGYVYLAVDHNILSHSRTAAHLCVSFCTQFHYGELVARVIIPRRVTVPGDASLNLHPVMPDADERIVLGTGWLHSGHTFTRNFPTVGLIPCPFRNQHWLSPEKLWRAFGQHVELTFEPIEKPEQCVLCSHYPQCPIRRLGTADVAVS